MQAGFHPSRGARFSFEPSPQLPQMLAAVIKVQQLASPWPAIGLHVPNPGRAVAQNQRFLGPGQSPTQRFPVQAPAQLQRLSLPTDDGFVTQHASTAVRLGRLLVQIKHPGLDFVPFHEGSVGLAGSPARTPKAGQPAVHQQDPQFTGFAAGFELWGQSGQAGLRLGFGPSPHPLRQRIQSRVIHRTTPLAG